MSQTRPQAPISVADEPQLEEQPQIAPDKNAKESQACRPGFPTVDTCEDERKRFEEEILKPIDESKVQRQK